MILQISLLLDSYPLIGLILIFLGSFVLIMSIFIGDENELPISLKIYMSLTMGGALMAGIIQIHQSEPFLLVLIFSMAGKYIEGLAAIIVYQKVLYGIRNRTISLLGIGFKTKILAILMIIFIVLLSGMVLSSMVLSDVIAIPLSEVLTAVWTMFIILYTIFGLTIKLYGSTPDDFTKLFTGGLILVITGSEVYNLSNIRLELILIAAGSISFSIGYWIAVIKFFEEGVITMDERKSNYSS